MLRFKLFNLALLFFLTSCSFLDDSKVVQKTSPTVLSLEEKIKILTKQISLNPNDADAYFSRASLYYQLQKYEKAQNDYQQASFLNPLFVDAYGMLGWILIQKGEFEKARNYCEQAYEMDKSSSAWTLNLAHVFLLSNDNKKASIYYKKALNLIFDYETFAREVIADFDFFIQKGWNVKAVGTQKEWMQVNFAKQQKRLQESILSRKK